MSKLVEEVKVLFICMERCGRRTLMPMMGGMAMGEMSVKKVEVGDVKMIHVGR